MKCKLEALDADLDNILRMVEAPRHLLTERMTPHLNRSHVPDASGYPWENSEVIDRIRIKYKPDFETLDYPMVPNIDVEP